ncbi:MAG: DUF4214 domain-containing protein, partial [bacterium]
VSFDNSNITTPQHLLSLSAIDQVLMTLGSGRDNVVINKSNNLRMITINTGPGDDKVQTVLSAASTSTQQFIGGGGADKLLISADNQQTWSQPGQVSTMSGSVQFAGIENVVVNDTPVMNGLPVAYQFVSSAGSSLGDLKNVSFVNMVYQQVLNRDATPDELARGTRQLDRRVLTRDQFALRVLNSTESLSLQVNAWYSAYLNRQATSQELGRTVAALRRGQSAQSLLGRLLTGQEFYNRTQQIVTIGSAADRYLTGLYGLVIAPTTSPDAALLQFLRQTLQKQGRLAAASQVLASSPMSVNQAQAISLKVNHQPADASLRTGKAGPNGLTARLLSRPSAKS